MKLEAPRLPATPESAGLMESVRHAREQVEDVVGRLFQGELLEHSQLGEVEFRGCIFENCRLTGAVFQRVAFTDVLFKDCDLSGAVWQRCGTQRCALRDCKAAGGDFSGAKLRHFLAENCRMPYANFSGAVCRPAAFTDLSRFALSQLTMRLAVFLSPLMIRTFSYSSS